MRKSFPVYDPDTHTDHSSQQLLSDLATHLAIAMSILETLTGKSATIELGQPYARAIHPKLAYSIREVQQLVGLGRTSIFKAMKEGRLRVANVGGRRLILASELSRWLQPNPSQSATSVGSAVGSEESSKK